MRSARSRFVLLASFVTLSAAPPAAAVPLFSISNRDPLLRVIDSTDGSTLDASRTITLDGTPIAKGIGLARHPSTGTLYAMVYRTDDDRQPRILVTLDERTGAATEVGELSDRFASIAFDGAGTLYAATGWGDDRNALYTLGTEDASATRLVSFGAERFDEGQALAYEPTRGLLHRLSNEWEGQVFEQIDPITLETRRTPLVDPLAEEAAFTALLFTGDGFLATDHGDVERGPSRFYELTEEGVVTQIGTLDHRSKGLAFVPEPSTALLLGGGLAALAVRRRGRRRAGVCRSPRS